MAMPSLVSILRALRSGDRRDFRRLAVLSGGYLLTGVLPRRLDPWAVGRLLRSSFVIRGVWVRRIVESMQQMLGEALRGADFESMARSYCEMVRETLWIRFRAFHTTRVPVETSVEGLHLIRNALGAGNGAILWGMSFCETLPVKIALHRACVPLIQLSSAFHGVPSETQLGLEVVGPFYSAPENPFLLERVNIPADGSLGFLRLLQDRLTENGCVYIRGDLRSRRSNIMAPVFGQDMGFALGAPGLSWSLRSPLLPIHVVRDGPFRYRAVVHPPIEADRSLDKKQFVRESVGQFAEMLERCASESPSDWEIWAGMV